MNANAIAVGGYSTARQFDCGSGSYTNGTSVAFNFTFANTPTVFISITDNPGSTAATNYLITYNAYNITKTGFTVRGIGIHWTNSVIDSMFLPGDAINWIAFG